MEPYLHLLLALALARRERTTFNDHGKGVDKGSDAERSDDDVDYVNDSTDENDDPVPVTKPSSPNTTKERWKARRATVEKKTKQKIWKDIRPEVRHMKNNVLSDLTGNISWMEVDVKDMNRHLFSMVGSIRFIKNEVLYIKRQAHVIWENVTDTRRDHKRMNKTLWLILNNMTLIFNDLQKTAAHVTNMQQNYGTIGDKLGEAVDKVGVVTGVTTTLQNMNVQFGEMKTTCTRSTTEMSDELSLVREIISKLGRTILDIKDYVFKGFPQVDQHIAYLANIQSRISSNVTTVSMKVDQQSTIISTIASTLYDVSKGIFTYAEKILSIWNLVINLGEVLKKVDQNIITVNDHLEYFTDRVSELDDRVDDIQETLYNIITQTSKVGIQIGDISNNINHHFHSANTNLGIVHDIIISNVSVVKNDLDQIKGQLTEIRAVIAEKCEAAKYPSSEIDNGIVESTVFAEGIPPNGHPSGYPSNGTGLPGTPVDSGQPHPGGVSPQNGLPPQHGIPSQSGYPPEVGYPPGSSTAYQPPTGSPTPTPPWSPTPTSLPTPAWHPVPSHPTTYPPTALPGYPSVYPPIVLTPPPAYPHIPAVPGTPEPVYPGWIPQLDEGMYLNAFNQVLREFAEMRQEMVRMANITAQEHELTRRIVIDEITRRFDYIQRYIHSHMDNIAKLSVQAINMMHALQNQIEEAKEGEIISLEIIASNIVQLRRQMTGQWTGSPIPPSTMSDRHPTYLPIAAPQPGITSGFQVPDFTPPGQAPSYVHSRPQTQSEGRPELMWPNYLSTQSVPYHAGFPPELQSPIFSDQPTERPISQLIGRPSDNSLEELIDRLSLGGQQPVSPTQIPSWFSAERHNFSYGLAQPPTEDSQFQSALYHAGFPPELQSPMFSDQPTESPISQLIGRPSDNSLEELIDRLSLGGQQPESPTQSPSWFSAERHNFSYGPAQPPTEDSQGMLGRKHTGETVTNTTEMSTSSEVAHRMFPSIEKSEESMVNATATAGKSKRKSRKGCATKRKYSGTNQDFPTTGAELVYPSNENEVDSEAYDKDVQEGLLYNVGNVSDKAIDTPSTEMPLSEHTLGTIQAPIDPLALHNLLQDQINHQLMNAMRPGLARRSKKKRLSSDRWRGRTRIRYKTRPRPMFPVIPGFPFIQRPRIPQVAFPNPIVIKPPRIQRPRIPQVAFPNPIVIKPPRIPNIFDQLPPGMLTAGIKGPPYSISYNNGKGSSWNVNVNRRHSSMKHKDDSIETNEHDETQNEDEQKIDADDDGAVDDEFEDEIKAR